MVKVKVSSRPESFYRAGMKFTREPRVVEVDEKALKVLQGEPMLVIQEPTVEELKAFRGAQDKPAEEKKSDGKGKK